MTFIYGKLKYIVKFTALAVALIMALAAFGCDIVDEYPDDIIFSDDMPPSVATEHSSFTTTLFFLSADKKRLIAEERTLTYDVARGRVLAAIDALLYGSETGLRRSVSASYALADVQVSANVCSVYLTSTDPLILDEWMIARSAIAATVYAVTGVTCTNVYYNGMTVGYYGMPLGAAGVLDMMLSEYLTDVAYEYERYVLETPDEEGLELFRTAAVYYQDAPSGLLIGRSASINYDGYTDPGEVIEQLLYLLAEVPADGAGLVSALPEDFTVVEKPSIVSRVAAVQPEEEAMETSLPQIDENEYIAKVKIEQPQSDYDEELMHSAIMLTLYGYFPNLMGVEITVQSETGNAGGVEEAELITRNYATAFLGDYVFVDYPSEDGSVLARSQYAVGMDMTNDLMGRLGILLDGTAGDCFSQFSTADVKHVYISDDMVVLDWEEGFLEKLIALQSATDEACSLPSETRIRDFVYSVVNTLTELPGVNSVWMLENGQKLGLAGEMYLGNALLRNPGISRNS